MPINLVLEIKHLKIGFSSENLLFQCPEMTCSKGEVTLLLGKNGSGKSTLLKAIVGLYQNVQGQGIIFNEKLFEISFKRKSEMLSLLPQQVECSPFLSVEDYVNLCGGYDQMLLQRLNIEKLMSQKMISLSGGELKRLAFYGCLSQKPKLLLLDEPFQSLDPEMKKVFCQEIKSYCSQGGTVLLNSHDFWWTKNIISSVYGIKEKEIVKGSLSSEFYSDIMGFHFDDELMPIRGKSI